MTERHLINFGIIADDVTGALDTGVQFAQSGLSAVLLIGEEKIHASVQVISTNSRNEDAEFAVQAVRAACNRLPDRRLFKKIDSTLRGHIAAEIEAVLAASGCQKAVICPAVIEAGRVTRDGQLWVGGQLIHESAFRDPKWPASTSNIAALIGAPVANVSEQEVGKGVSALIEKVEQTSEHLVAVDAASLEDLETIGKAAAASGWLPCGALGLARAWSRAVLGHEAEPAAALPSANGPLLVVIGSLNPRTRAQTSRLSEKHGCPVFEITGEDHGGIEQQIVKELAANRTVIVRTPLLERVDAQLENFGHRHPAVRRLAEMTEKVVKEVKIGGLLISGGDTTLAVLSTLRTSAIKIIGELHVGVPIGQLIGGTGSGLPVITKAGGFGDDDVLLRLFPGDVQ
jgi:D-threonate/D-erythronate kinase